MSSYQVINFSLGILLCLPSCTACTYSTVIISFLLGQPEAKKPAQLSSGMWDGRWLAMQRHYYYCLLIPHIYIYILYKYRPAKLETMLFLFHFHYFVTVMEDGHLNSQRRIQQGISRALAKIEFRPIYHRFGRGVAQKLKKITQTTLVGSGDASGSPPPGSSFTCYILLPPLHIYIHIYIHTYINV